MTTVRLGDVLEPRREVVHPRDNPSGEALFVGLDHIESNTGRRIGGLEVRLEELTGRKPRFHAGDIVYGYLRPYLNKVWVADRPGLCSVDQYVFAVRANADPNFVGAFLRSPSFLRRAPIGETPGQLPRIRLDEILSVPLELPPVDEQRQIAVALAEQAIAGARARTESHARRQAIVQLRASIRSQLFARLPGGRHRLGDILNQRASFADGPFGSNLKSDHYQPSGVRVIRLGNIGLGEFLDADRAYVSEEHFRSLLRHSVTPGDVVVAALGDGIRPAGRACVVPDHLGPALVKADCFRIRTESSPLNGAYLMHFLNTPETLRLAFDASRGATRPRMTLGMLRDLRVPVPNLQNQNELVANLEARLANVDAIAKHANSQAGLLDSISAALLSRAFGT